MRFFSTNQATAQGIVNGQPPMQDYIQKRQRGNSALVRVEHVLGPGNQSHFKPATLPNAA
jgi:hypothetical protein